MIRYPYSPAKPNPLFLTRSRELLKGKPPYFSSWNFDGCLNPLNQWVIIFSHI